VPIIFLLMVNSMKCRKGLETKPPPEEKAAWMPPAGGVGGL
jgi:hypothetical protein